MRLRLKQYFCKHKFIHIARHKDVQENLWKCEKCGAYCIQHYGIGNYYFSKTPHINGWIYKNKEKNYD